MRRGAVRANPPAAASSPATPLTLAVAETQLARVAHAARASVPTALPVWDRATGVSMHLVEPEAARRVLGLVAVGKAFFLRKKEAASIRASDVTRLTLRGVELARCLLHQTKMSGRRSGPTDFIDPCSGAEFSFSADPAAIAWLDQRLARRPSAGGSATPARVAPARAAAAASGRQRCESGPDADSESEPLLQAVLLRRRPVREDAAPHVWVPAEKAGASERWEPTHLSDVLSAFFSPGLLVGAVALVHHAAPPVERFSLRAGAAVDALEHHGQPIEWVAKVGRWASTQTIAAHYHRLVGSAFPLAVAERHARAYPPRGVAASPDSPEAGVAARRGAASPARAGRRRRPRRRSGDGADQSGGRQDRPAVGGRPTDAHRPRVGAPSRAEPATSQQRDLRAQRAGAADGGRHGQRL